MAMARTEPFKAPPLARIGYARNLLKPRPNDKGVLKFDCTLMWPKTADVSILKQMAGEVAIKEWGDKAGQMIKDGLIKNPILDGDGPQGVNKESGVRYPELVGHWFIRPNATAEYTTPRIVSRKVLPITTEGDEYYSGCYVNAVLNAYCWTNAQNGKGISFGILAVQVAKDGERIGSGGGIDPGKHFESIADESAAIAETKKDASGAAALFA